MVLVSVGRFWRKPWRLTMLKEILSKLKDEKVEIATGENSIGKTLIAEKYLALVAGGRQNPVESL